MNKIIASFVNELRLFLKDIAGVALLFLMPLALTVIMALIQDAPFREYQDIEFDILWVDEDGGKMSREMATGLDSIAQFKLIRSVGGKPLTAAQVKQLVQKGSYKIAIVVPQGITAEVANSANQVANIIGSNSGAVGKLPQRSSRPISIEVYFDPVTKQAMKLSLLHALEQQLTRVQAEHILSRLEARVDSDSSGSSGELNLKEKLNVVTLREYSGAPEGKINLNTNSVQHNVPAWAIFGLFFIIIPIAGNAIREREDGSLMRIKMIPGSYLHILIGKMGFYVILGMLQFFAMMGIAYYLMPYLGLPALRISGAYGPLLLAVFAIAATATTYGFLIGTLFQTPNQALPFGAISIVILSAIGGIWVPVEILPAGLQQLATISPLYWSLDLVNDVFLRNVGLTTMAPKLGVLAVFMLGFLLLAASIESRRVS